MANTISLNDFARAYDEGVVVVDVREAEEYAQGHVPGAIFAPLSALAGHLPSLPRGETVYVICRSGQRSLTAADAMTAAGITAVSVDGGTLGWIDAGRPVEV